MALPIWALYMKGAYENEALGISQEEFLAPRWLVLLWTVRNTRTHRPHVPAKSQADLDQLGF